MKPLGFVLLLSAAIAAPAYAGVLTGTVLDTQGNALVGVLVRLTDEASGISESVYSNAAGKYVLATNLSGELELRLRTPYFKDASSAIELGASSKLTKDLVMSPMTDAKEISDSLPAAYHFGSLPFAQGKEHIFSRLQFQRDCLTCHQLGNEYTRIPRTVESWIPSIQRMHDRVENPDMTLVNPRAEFLAKGFVGELLTVRPEFPVDESLSNMKIYEYLMRNALSPHDAIYNPNDELFYSVDAYLEQMVVTDAATGQSEYVVQSKDNPEHYPNSRPRNTPHSLALGHDGKYYVTHSSSDTIGVFNPMTRAWEATLVIPEETGANYPHTIRVDKEGIVWFTLAFSEQVGRLDPVTKEFKILDTPSQTPMGYAGNAIAYGIDIHPIDGSIWYAKLFTDRIGRVDPETLEITEYDSPVSGPRRLHFDKEGVLWVTGYSEGTLARIETEGYKTKVYEMPEFAPDMRPAPYALGVHPKSQEIWINETMTDRIYRFIPDEERFVVYPVPLRGSYTRDMTFTKEGQVCASNNPIPPGFIETGEIHLLCFDPYYDPEEAAVSN